MNCDASGYTDWDGARTKLCDAAPPAGLKILKIVVTEISEATGTPCNDAGVKVQSWTASCTELVKGGESRKTWTFWMFALLSKLRSSDTAPEASVFTG